MEDSNFMSSFGGTTASVIVVSVIGGIAWWVKNKCKHSKSRCGSENSCFQIEFQEDSIELQKKKTERSALVLEIIKELKKESLVLDDNSVSIPKIKIDNNI